jgi:hypothetical protein
MTTECKGIDRKAQKIDNVYKQGFGEGRKRALGERLSGLDFQIKERIITEGLEAGKRETRANYERGLDLGEKMTRSGFLNDVDPL